jgi:pimeloyl-ACP methyl ester carboxylesterase
MKNLSVSRGMVKTAVGAVGYLLCQGRQEQATITQQQPQQPPLLLAPVLCFHCSPRSSDEYLELLPLLASTGRNVIAFDVPGYGISENPSKSCSTDDIADAFLEAADQVLGKDNDDDDDDDDSKPQKYVTIGSLMGNFHAVSLASRYPDRIAACILANLFYFPPNKDQPSPPPPPPPPKRQQTDDDTGTPRPDPFELQEDGSHLVKLHTSRKWLDPELKLRVVQGELTYLVNRRARYAKGISIEDLKEYHFEGPAQQTKCPTLCVRGESCLAFFDAIGLDGTQQFKAGVQLFPNVHVEAVEGPKSTINMINQLPDEFAAVCKNFLDVQGV